MKILVVHNSYQQPGGEDIVFEQETQMLKRADHQVLVYRRSNREADGSGGLRQIQLALRTVWAEDTRKEFARLLRHEKPELVHVHNTFFMISPSIFSACREAGVPVVQTLHNYRLYCPASTFFRNGHVCEECVEHSLLRGIAHACYHDSRAHTAVVALLLAVHRQRQTWTRDVDCNIALSKFARNRFLNAGLPAEKVFVKPNFVYPDPCMHANNAGDYVLFVGHLWEERVRTLLAAWHHLCESRIPLVIIGSSPQLEELKEESIRRGLSHVSFRGHLPRQQTLAAMHKARFLVFSSEWYENFPVTIAESFACGVPVICSRLGAMEEIVQDGCTGLHFSPGDDKDLAEKVEWAWNHPEHMRLMGKEARHEYETKYTPERNYTLLMEIYRHALERKYLLHEMRPILAG
jgi:glycosyltransferase involved in cell wall biosynthesis